MRRVALALFSTVTGLVMLLSFKTHSSTASVPVATAPAVPAGTSAGDSATSTDTQHLDRQPSTGTDDGTVQRRQRRRRPPRPRRRSPATPIDTRYGPVQVQITVTNGKITAVNAVEYPQNDPRDQQINSYAIPQLNQRRSPPRARTSTWSPAPPTPARATSARCRAPWTRQACDMTHRDARASRPAHRARRALHGHRLHHRHPRPRPLGSPRSPRSSAGCTTSTRCSAPTGRQRHQPACSAVSCGWPTPTRTSGRCWSCAPQAQARTGGAFTAMPQGRLDPTGLVKGWADRAGQPAAEPARRAQPRRQRRRRPAAGRLSRARPALGGRHQRSGATAAGSPARVSRPGLRGGHLRDGRARQPHPRPAHRPAGHRAGQRHRGRPVADLRRRLRHRRLRPGPATRCAGSTRSTATRRC